MFGSLRRLRGTGFEPAQRGLDPSEEKGIERDGDERGRKDELLAGLGEEVQGAAHFGEDEGELADLGETGGNSEAYRGPTSEEADDEERGDRFARNESSGSSSPHPHRNSTSMSSKSNSPATYFKTRTT